MRRTDWLERMMSYVEASEEKEFVWGSCDCCLWVADAVQVMTGTDFADAFRGKYSSRRGAAAALRKYGGGTLDESIPLPTVGVAYAQRGDVMLVQTDDGPALGLCMGELTAVKAKHAGIVYVRSYSCRLAWSVEQ